jgi:hypothetical protein
MWEITDSYDPNIPPNGSMVVLLEPYRSNSWPIFGDGVMRGTAATKRAEMDCPNCLAQLAPSGKLRVLAPVEEVKEPEVPVEEVPQEEVPQEEVPQEEVPQEEVPKAKRSRSRNR